MEDIELEWILKGERGEDVVQFGIFKDKHEDAKIEVLLVEGKGKKRWITLTFRTVDYLVKYRDSVFDYFQNLYIENSDEFILNYALMIESFEKL